MGEQLELDWRDRFMGYVDVGDAGACWLWTAGRARNGYGKFKLHGRTLGAHRLMYLLYYGNLPDNSQVCHTCDNRPCVNPKHLFLGTCRDNMKDKVSKHRQARGGTNGRSVFDETTAAEIKTLRRAGWKLTELAARFGVNASSISHLCIGRKWRHVG